MTSVCRPKSLCRLLDQRCWIGGPLSSTPKRNIPRSPQSVSETVFREIEARSYLPPRLNRPFHRARAAFRITLRSTPPRLKTQGA